MKLILIACLLCTARLAYLTVKGTHKSVMEKNQSLMLKGILSLMIVLHHLSFGLDSLKEFKDIGITVVAAFFFLSSYGLTKSCFKDGRIYLSGFWKKRGNKGLLPALIATLLFLGWRIFHNGENLGVLFHNYKNGIPILPTSWFVYVILIYYIALFCALTITHSLTGGILLMGIFTALYIAAIMAIGWSLTWWISVPAFNIGMLVVWLESHLKSGWPYTKRPIACAWGGVITCLLGCCLIISTIFPQFQPFRYYIYVIFVPIILYLGFRVTDSKVLLWIGGISYEIYLVQGVVTYSIVSFISHPIICVIAALIQIYIFALVLRSLTVKIDKSIRAFTD